MHPGNLLRTLWVHFTVALLVGLILGTGIGIVEGASVLLSQGVLGRYNELVAWAIVVDAGALTGVEFGLALLGGLILFLVRLILGSRKLVGRRIQDVGRSLAPRGRSTGARPQSQVAALVSLQLGETVFVMTLAWGIWSQGTVNPSLFANNPLGVLLPPAVVGLVLGEFVLAATVWIGEHASIIGRLHTRHWLILEGVVVALAIAFGFTR